MAKFLFELSHHILGEMKKRFEDQGMEADLWPLPDWAFVSAAASGGCILVAAWMMSQGAASSPRGYYQRLLL